MGAPMDDLAAAVKSHIAELAETKAELEAARQHIAELEAKMGEAVKSLGESMSASESSSPTSGAPSTTDTEPSAGKSVYTFDGDPSQIVASDWTSTGFLTSDGLNRDLYTYVNDSNPGDANGDGINGQWHLYTGAYSSVRAAS